MSEGERLFDWMRERGVEPGERFTKAELGAALGRPFDDNREVIYRVRRRMERELKRTLVCVFGEGYRVAEATETPGIVGRRLRRAGRQLAAGRHTAVYTDRGRLSQEDRRELDRCLGGVRAVERELKQQKERLAGVEARVETLEEAPQISPAELQFLREQMEAERRRRAA